MRKLLLLFFTLISVASFGQLKEKDQSRLTKYELLLKEGNIYSSRIKEDKLLKKYPLEASVLDFSIRLCIEKIKDSYNSDVSSIEQAMSKPVRAIRYRKIVDHLETLLQNNLIDDEFCKYYYFLLDYQYESPYDRPPTPFKEIYERQLNLFKNHCTTRSKIAEVKNYNSSTDTVALSFYNKGHDSFAEGNFQEAILLYKKAVHIDPNFIEAIDNLALTFRQTNELDSAKKYYMASIEKYPIGELAYQNLGTVGLIEEDFQNALYRFHQLSEVNPNNAEAYFGSTKAYLAIEQYKPALTSGLKCEEIYKSEASSYLVDIQYLIGLTYYFMNDQSNSKIYLQKSLNKGFNVPNQLITELELKEN